MNIKNPAPPTNGFSTLIVLHAKPIRRMAGIMSGTSADGIDVAVCDISKDGTRCELVVGATRPFEPALAERVRAAGRGNVEALNRLDADLGDQFARAVVEVLAAADLPVSSLDAVASHGLTVDHRPGTATLQIGNAARLAERLGCVIISDFRSRDVAAGGQGAPLVPFADWCLLADPHEHRVALNIGGIANITCLPAGCKREDVIAFDTGPGNMIMDAVALHLSGGRNRMDQGGAWAGLGCPDEDLLAWLLDDDFLRAPPPKSTGRARYGQPYVDRLLAHAAQQRLPDEDVLRTLCAFTAEAIARAIRPIMPEPEYLVIASGGGVFNKTLMKEISARVLPARLRKSSMFGIDVSLKEAIAFALLGNETLSGRSANMPSATGAAGPRILGSITLP